MSSYHVSQVEEPINGLDNGHDNGHDEQFNENLHDTIMYFHTALRNIGLYTSMAIAIFTFSNFFAVSYFKNQRVIVRTAVRLLAVFILIGTCWMCYSINSNLTLIIDKFPAVKNSSIINIHHWHNLLIFIFVIEIFILVACIFATYQHFINKKYQ